MGSAALQSRMTREIRMLQTEPPPGVWAAPVGDSLTRIEAQLQGPKDTVYEGGLFKLAVDIPARYPFEPPKVKFVTPIYHPNIDPEGRICLDLLNMPPKGAWKPSLNVPTLLASLGLLLAEPNPDDGLVTDITAEFKHQRAVFDSKARQWTQRHAVQQGNAAAAGGGGESAAAAAGKEEQQGQQEHNSPQLAAPGALAPTEQRSGPTAVEAGKEDHQPEQQVVAGAGGAAKEHQEKSVGVVAQPPPPPAETAEQQPAPKRSRLALRQ